MSQVIRKKYIFLVLVVFILAAFSRVVAKPFRICGDCMEPAVKDGKLCFLNRASSYIRQYKVNDIIAFTYEGKPWISRIVALEGDAIEIKESMVLVNGISYSENEINRNWCNWDCGTYAINQSLTVPSGHVFVLSDNLDAEHDDSRQFGPISNSTVLGLVWQ